jgi:hypothetical protein
MMDDDLTHDVSTAAATALSDAVTFDDDAAAERFFDLAYAVVTAAIAAYRTETEDTREPDCRKT